MEEDTSMPDAHEPAYPHPSIIQRTPEPYASHHVANGDSPTPTASGQASPPQYSHLSAGQRAPEPYLWRNVTNGTRPPPLFKHATPTQSATSTFPTPTAPEIDGSLGQMTAIQSAASTPRKYLTLADYFNIRRGVFTGAVRPSEELPIVNETPETFHTEDELLEEDPLNPPLTPAQHGRSLPGFHALPEDDTPGSGLQAYLPPPPKPWYSRNSKDDSPSSGRGSSRLLNPGRARRGRRGDRDENQAVKRGSWKKLLKKHDQTRGAEGPSKTRKPRAKKPGRPPGPTYVDPGSEFKQLQAQANEAFMNHNYDEALEYALRAVQVNPEVFTPHWIISRVLKAQGKREEALEALQNATVAQPERDHWIMLAEEVLDVAGPYPTADKIERAVSYYTNAVNRRKGDVENYPAHKERMRLYLELGDLASARKECKRIAEIRPDDLDNAHKFANLCSTTGPINDTNYARLAYERAFEHVTDITSLGTVDDQWTHLNLYLELVTKLHRYAEGVQQLKRIARWILGRKEDSFWDDFKEDDREFDTTHERRLQVWQFRQSGVTPNHHQYNGLPMEIRVKLGLFRLNMGSSYRNEAFRHFEHLLQAAGEIEELSDLFYDVADTLRSRQMFTAAINFYEPIATVSWLPNERFWLAIASCYYEIGRLADAEKCYQNIIDADDYNVEARRQLAYLYDKIGQSDKAYVVAEEARQRCESSGHKAEFRYLKKRLADKIDGITPYVENPRMKQPRPSNKRFLPLTNLAPRPKGWGTRPLGEDSPASKSKGRDGRKRDPIGEAQAFVEQRDRTQESYAAVQQLWPSLEIDEDEASHHEWALHAAVMAEDFRTTKLFYTTGRSVQNRYMIVGPSRTPASAAQRDLIKEMEAMKEQVRAKIDESANGPLLSSADEAATGEFHDIPFTKWHHIICQLALLYAKYVDQSRCYDILQGVLMGAHVFNRSRRLMNTTFAVCMRCALIFNDGKLMTEIAKQYLRRGQERSDMAVRFLAATGRFSNKDPYTDDSHLREHILHMLKEQDYHFMTPEMRSKSGQLNGDKKLPAPVTKDLDAGLLTLYGHIANTHQHGNSYSALPFLLRALALQPENLVVNLTIATIYISEANREKNGTKQANMAQGLAFLSRYYDLRTASGKARHLQEAEFNVARIWHQLGSVHMAIPAYEKALGLSSQVQEEYIAGGVREDEDCEDFAKEAAFALQGIFASAGNEQAVRAITEEWLVI